MVRTSQVQTSEGRIGPEGSVAALTMTNGPKRISQPFLEEFLLCLRWRPRQAMAALYWLVTRRVVRAGNTLRRDSGRAPYAYRLWRKRVERPRVTRLPAAGLASGKPGHPRFTVILTSDGQAAADHASSIASVRAQTCGDWELLVRATTEVGGAMPPGIRPIEAPADPAGFIAAAIEAARGEWIVWLRAGDLLPPWALQQYAASAQAQPDVAMLFGDQDRMDPTGRRTGPWFKPQWNREMVLAQDYVSAAAAMRTAETRRALAELGVAAVSPYALMLTAAAAMAHPPAHVRQIQLHARGEDDDATRAMRLETVRRHLDGQGCAVTAGPFGTLRIDWPLPPDRPHVSIIVPTRDRVALVRTCVDSVIAKTGYPNFDVIIVDNGSVEPETARYFADVARNPRVRVLPCPGPFNFAAINNAAAHAATGAYLCFLNNDTEVIDADWLDALLRQAARPETGAAGAMLLYGDGTIQHAGVVIGLGGAAGHAHRNLAPDDPGYFAQAHVQREVSAVTAACLLVRKDRFLAVGGFDEGAFAVAYNDVDLCLRLQAAGWRNVFVPQARLYHHESKSRGNDLAPAHRERYLAELAALQDRWGTRTYLDPLHHADLDARDEAYAISFEDRSS
nr:glycosyltransferase family 2 protein [Novosphingobium aerophilum]